MTIFTQNACPQKTHLEEQTSLSRITVSRRTNDLSDDIKETFKDILKSCAVLFGQALYESTDISDTNQLVIFIRAVAVGFYFVEEFVGMESLSSITTERDIYGHVIRVEE